MKCSVTLENYVLRVSSNVFYVAGPGGEGPDIDEETTPDQVNNEVEVMGKC
jgi:hypothetical protein